MGGANVLPVLEETDALVPDTALVPEGPAGDTPSLLTEDAKATHQYCTPACTKEALDKLDENIQLVRDIDEPDPKNNNKETSTHITSETAVKTKNIATDISKPSCNKKTNNTTKNTGDTTA